MENALRNELEDQKSKLISNTNQDSWWKWFGFQQSTIEEIYRKQCAKELERLLISRQQLDQTIKNNNSTVRIYIFS